MGKRDIFNSSKTYAESLYNELNFNAATLKPHMVKDAIIPFSKVRRKMSIILLLHPTQVLVIFKC